MDVYSRRTVPGVIAVNATLVLVEVGGWVGWFGAEAVASQLEVWIGRPLCSHPRAHGRLIASTRTKAATSMSKSCSA